MLRAVTGAWDRAGSSNSATGCARSGASRGSEVIEAQALRRVPSTEKCSRHSSRLTFGSASNAARKSGQSRWSADDRSFWKKLNGPRPDDRSQRRKKAQDISEPYLATTGGHDKRMSSVSSIAGAPVNVVLPRGKDDDQNWPPKAPIESITVLAELINIIDPKWSSIRRHPAAVSGAETV
jgi:hypothetical protein